ncbi:hypothetical protein M2371_004292 [Buttiauxella sp. BIGb0471]|uniref:hypothetical protein n=1 Tax=Buttiauxella sp. BIGb0471 TaxID=2940597 RepID=UPI002167A542|nr:hypothetical protein [Buttiauxella sp. BIGb0471]MCS3605038.1 hypothetical protein [Buttiauxella sp. BIGb0471]
MTSTDAKRQILAKQPGKEFSYLNASAHIVDAAYAGYMAQHHPEIRTDEIDGYAMAHAAATTKGA